jgi:sigma-E factor negative regulatory protein RseA
MNDAIKMQISAFVDGELPQNEAELLLRRLCQDGKLRQQAAEFLAMGRAIRGERSVPGIVNLRGRISAALDDATIQEEPDVITSARPRFLRPLAGVAIAATVALAALLGLQQVSVGPDVEVLPGDSAVAESADDGAYTVPDQGDDPLRDYYLRHSASSSYFGANSINARLVTLQLREGVIVDSLPSELPDEDPQEETPESANPDTP